MIVITYSPTYCHVKCNLIEKREIKRLLSARPDGYKFAPKFKKGWWDGYITLLDKLNQFPSGLLNYVMDNLDAGGWDYDVLGYEDISFSFKDPEIAGYTFRDYQLEAVRRAVTYERGILKMATNAGKTLVAAGIIQVTGCMAIMIVPTVALIEQTANELSAMLNMKIGQYGGGHTTKCDVTVTTTASLGKLVQNNDLSANITLIIDECHHTKSNSVFDHIFSIPAAYRIGMSGTPLTYERLADMKLVGATGDVIYEIKNTELIEAGYSAKPTIIFSRIDTDIPAKTKYQMVYKLGIVQNTQRNAEIVRIARQERSRGPVLIICDWVEHVNNITSLDKSFLSATGNTSKAELENLLAQYDQSNDVLVASPIFSEGVNIPSVTAVIIASGNRSHIQILQRIGRGLRKTAAKDAVHVYDFIDTGHKHIFKHSEQRYKLYKEEGFDMEMMK